MSSPEEVKLDELEGLTKKAAEPEAAAPRRTYCQTPHQSFLDAIFVDFTGTDVKTQLTGTKVKGTPTNYALSAQEQGDRAGLAVGPNSTLTESELRSFHKGHHPEFADRATLLLKIGLSLLAYGRPTVMVEEDLIALARAMELPPLTVAVHVRSIDFRIQGGPWTSVTCSKGFNLDKSKDVSKLVQAIIAGQPFDVVNALQTVDQVNDRGGSYGWVWLNLSLAILLVNAAYSAFLGTWNAVIATALVVPFVILTTAVAGRWEMVLVPFVVGVVVPICHRFWIPIAPDEFSKVYLSAMLIWLPGSDLTFGALEIFYGSIVNGTSRMFTALIKAMLIAMSLSIGWQFAGYGMAYDWVVGDDLSKLSSVPVAQAAPPYDFNYTFGVGNLLMVPNALLGLGVRIRDIPGAALVVYVTLYVFATLTFYCGPNGTCTSLPKMVVNFLGMLVGGILSNIYEYVTDIPSVVPTIPIVLILAPGSGLVLACLALTNFESEISTHNALIPFLDGVCYTLGWVVATAICRVCLKRKAAARAKEYGKKLVDVQEDFLSGNIRY